MSKFPQTRFYFWTFASALRMFKVISTGKNVLPKLLKYEIYSVLWCVFF